MELTDSEYDPRGEILNLTVETKWASPTEWLRNASLGTHYFQSKLLTMSTIRKDETVVTGAAVMDGTILQDKVVLDFEPETIARYYDEEQPDYSLDVLDNTIWAAISKFATVCEQFYLEGNKKMTNTDTNTDTSTNTTADDGTTVTLHYKGTLEDGTQFDNSYDRGEPITVTVGSGQLIEGFDTALLGMTAGETKSFTLSAAEAYGETNPDAQTVLDKAIFPDDFEFSSGMAVPLTGPEGKPFMAVITEIEDTTVTADLNHPLAGKSLTFDLEILSVGDPADEA